VAGEPVPAVLATPPAALLSSPAHELRRVATTHARYLRHDSGPLGRDRAQARLLSNKTHYSPTDPDARISVKPGKVRALNYLCSMAVDEGHGLISHTQADFIVHEPRLSGFSYEVKFYDEIPTVCACGRFFS
jgi:hypothetical protein